MKRQLPKILGLFQKRIEGDDALLRLAALRFGEAGLGTEIYAESVEHLGWMLGFRPDAALPAAVHLGRGLDLMDGGDRLTVLEFASFCHQSGMFGLVAHDQPEVSERPEEYVNALHELESGLRKIRGGPRLFIEYAVGLRPEAFIELFRDIRPLERISACIDVGHIGLWRARDYYYERHPGEDVCGLLPESPALPEVIGDVQESVRAALDTVLFVARELFAMGKPLHFHLHDGHPLSSSPDGVSDHLSFTARMRIPFEHGGEVSLAPMFGPSGLREIVAESFNALGPERVSYSLEIHPRDGRTPLSDATGLFEHWTDKGNAERMNHWLSVIVENQRLVLDACEKGRTYNETA